MSEDSIPKLANLWLERLRILGLHTRAPEEDSYQVQLQSGQRFYITFRGRDSRGLRVVEVDDFTLRDDQAIINALTTIKGDRTNISRLDKEILPKIKELISDGSASSILEALTQILPKREGGPKDPEQIQAQWDGIGHLREGYEINLLEYYRPAFASYQLEEQLSLFRGVCEHINRLLGASQGLVRFLEYGSPGRDLRPEIENAVRDAKATVLSEAGGLTNRAIAEELEVPAPKNVAYKGDYPAIRQMIKRGKKILQSAMGTEEWKRKAQTIHEDFRDLCIFRKQWYSEEIADAYGLQAEEVAEHLQILIQLQSRQP